MWALRDEDGVITGWFLRVLFGLAFMGLIVFEGGAVLVNYFGLDSTANDIVQEVASNVPRARTVNIHDLERQAQRLARDASARLVKIELDRTTDVLTIAVRRRASTLVVHHIDRLRSWVRPTVEAQAPTN